MLKIDNELFDKLLKDAANSPRKRAHFNIHKEYDEPVQRLCIGLLEGTYIRPHYHPRDKGWEIIMALKGVVALLIFNEEGVVTEKKELSPETGSLGVELKPRTYHMVFPVSHDAILFEIKEGPFMPKEMCDFVAWAPEEGDDDVDVFLEWAKNATVGSRYK